MISALCIRIETHCNNYSCDCSAYYNILADVHAENIRTAADADTLRAITQKQPLQNASAIGI